MKKFATIEGKDALVRIDIFNTASENLSIERHIRTEGNYFVYNKQIIPLEDVREKGVVRNFLIQIKSLEQIVPHEILGEFNRITSDQELLRKTLLTVSKKQLLEALQNSTK